MMMTKGWTFWPLFKENGGKGIVRSIEHRYSDFIGKNHNVFLGFLPKMYYLCSQLRHK